MADVRALLAAEKTSRRISHPHATYSRSGVLSCWACSLPIKAEALWEGHLKSANHRKNAAKATAAQLNKEYSTPVTPHQQALKPSGPLSSSSSTSTSGTRNLKRKIEDVEEHDAQQEEQEYKVDGSKKPKSSTLSVAPTTGTRAVASIKRQDTGTRSDQARTGAKHVHFSPSIDADADVDSEDILLPNRDRRGQEQQQNPDLDLGTDIYTQTNSGARSDTSNTATEAANPSKPLNEAYPNQAAAAAVAQEETSIDEDEWAAFESDMTSLVTSTEQTSNPNTATTTPTPFSSSTNGTVIQAAPLTTQQLQQQKAAEEKAHKNMLLDSEIADEHEDESRRMEAEFDVMEEMEERVRRLKEKRETLRAGVGVSLPKDVLRELSSTTKSTSEVIDRKNPPRRLGDGYREDDDDDDDDEITTTNVNLIGAAIVGNGADEEDEDDDNSDTGQVHGIQLKTTEENASSDEDDDDEDDWYA